MSSGSSLPFQESDVSPLWDLEGSSPSEKDGLTKEMVHQLKKEGIEFILHIVHSLHLPVLTSATSSVFFHRFFALNSLADWKPCVYLFIYYYYVFFFQLGYS